MKLSQRLRSKFLSSFGGAALVLLSMPANTAMVGVDPPPGPPAINVSDTPLFLAVTVPPNIAVTLDDSGSMKRGFTPDLCGNAGDDCATLDNRWTKANRANPMYYNPFVQYPQARRADGTVITTSFTAAWNDGFDTAFGSVNLSNNYRPTSYLNHGDPAVVTHGYMGHYSTDARCATTGVPLLCQIRGTDYVGYVSGTTTCVGGSAAARDTFCRGAAAGTSPNTADTVPGGVPAYYYLFDATRVGCDGTNGDNDCYKIVIVTSTSGPGGTDERQNFANWYSFARTRNLATQTAATLAFNSLDPNVRVAWQGVNSCFNGASLVDTDCDGWRNNFTGVSNAIRPFTGTHRQNFYNWVMQQNTRNSTPLPVAMTRAGEYFRTTGDNSPYDNVIGTPGGGSHSCRRNYHIMMTDGLWNATVGIGDIDNSTILLPEVATEPEPDITQYTPRPPYRDATTNTLADVSLRYALMDLVPTLPNNVLPIYRDRTGTATQQYWDARNDPYTWQHMVNFNIGLGLTNFLASAGLTWTGNTYAGSYPLLASGITAWPAASTAANNPANVADLWHSALNSRGQFFSADNPAALGAAFRDALVAITSDAGSAAALSTNSTSIQPGSTYVYQAKFSRGWTGTLLALPIAANGSVGSQIWDASREIPAWSSRLILTHDGTKGQYFNNCSNLAGWQRDLLDSDYNGVYDGNCTRRLDWLRGNATDEQRNAGPYRNRPDTVMGDIINSDPAYVKNINYRYNTLPSGVPGGDDYSNYVNDNDNREAMVYVGANDGMLHAFRASDGVERFAYVPLGVYPNLSRLTSPSYEHRFYVDGGITAGDAYWDGAWHTVVTAGLNAGGRTVFALDVTDPDNFDDKDILWEFTDPDMGQSFSQPQIGILKNGTWVAVFGNGYNSPSGGAILYIVDLHTGALLKKIVAQDLAGNEGNGLSTPLLYDANNNRTIDYVYAGDLHGNMWKFDVSGNWGEMEVAFSGQPLFTARNAAGQVQQITAQPKAAANPLGGTMVLFGTGQYITMADVSDLREQSFYGIRDYGSTPITSLNRSELLQQTIDLQTAAFGRDVRSVTGFSPNWATHRGWYLDLLDPPPTSAVGERVVSTPLLISGRVIFVTAIPSSDPCKPGGTSWLMEVDYVTGGTFNSAVLDMNRDGKFDSLDDSNGQVLSGVRNQNLGISKTPVLLRDDTNEVVHKIQTGLSGGFEGNINCDPCGGPPPPGGGVVRRSWIQIR